MKIPGYTIIRELAQGGMATVYLARQDRLDRDVALKVMDPGAGVDNTFTARFIKESRIIARLQHSQIVTIHDFDTCGQYHYFSMEYLPGGTLAERIRFGLTPEQALDILRRIGEALAYAHARNVIHRDIKPQNILFRDGDTPVLTDFGIARAAAPDGEATQLTRVDTIIGSPKYMSPEQILGQELDHRSDLYSLGIVFYEMLTGRPPFSGGDVVALAMKHCSEPLPPLPRELRRLQKLLDRLTAKRPEDRFASATEMVEAIDALTVVVRKDRTGGGDDTRKGMPRAAADDDRRGAAGRRWPLLLAAAVLVALSTGAGYWLLAERGAREPDIALGLPPPPPGRPEAADNYESLALLDAADGRLERSLDLIRLGLEAAPRDARLLALRQRVKDRRQAAEDRKRARALAEQGDLDGALAAVDDGLKAVPDDRGLKELKTRLEERRQEAESARAGTLLAEARRLFNEKAYGDSLEKAEAGLSLRPGDTDLLALRDAVQAAVARQRRVQGLLREARRKMKAEALDEARALVRQGLAIEAGDQALLALKNDLAAADAEHRRRLIADIEEQARARLEQDDYQAALTVVSDGLEQVGDDSGLRELRDDIKRQSDRAHQAALLSEARRLFDEKAYGESLEKVRTGLSLRPGDADLLALRDAVQAALAQQHQVQVLLAEARAKRDEGALDEAQALVRQGLAIDAGNPDLLALTKDLAAAAERRRRLVADIEERARARMGQDDYQGALAVVSDGLEQIGDDDGLRGLRDDIERELDRARQVQLLVARAEALRGSGEFEASRAVVDRALAVAPIDPAVIRLRDLLAQDLAHRQKIAKLVAGCRPRLPADDGEPADAAAAVQCWQSVLEADPANADASAALARIERLLPDWIAARLGRQQPDRARSLLDLMAGLAPDHDRLDALRADIEVAARRLELAPAMVHLPQGCYRMGTPTSAPEREDDERPHRVCVDAFELGRDEVTVAQFRRFVEAAGYRTDAERGTGGQSGCWTLGGDEHNGGDWKQVADADWRRPLPSGPAADDQPVTCISWNDARAYIQWLNGQTRETYRLPTEAEWEYAARAGTDTARPWGDGTGGACAHANVADRGHDWKDGFDCDDGHEWAAAVGSYPANAWGLHDMMGNVWEWTCSRYEPDYAGAEARCAPADANAPLALRGGSWYSGPATVRSAYRDRAFPELRYSFLGFRLARDPPATAPTPP